MITTLCKVYRDVIRDVNLTLRDVRDVIRDVNLNLRDIIRSTRI